MIKLIGGLIRPYWVWALVVLLAMAVETAMSLASPWPLKVVIDNVVGSEPAPRWFAEAFGRWLVDNKMALTALSALGILLIAALGAGATYIDNYYTESIGQWVANDLRVRVYHHLEHFSLSYYDKVQTATLLSTITDDIETIEDFVSSSTMSIAVDLLTIAAMLALMFWLNFEFALVAIAVAPLLVLFVATLKTAVKGAQREVRRKQSVVVAVVQQGLESMRVVMSFGREDLEEARLAEASRDTVAAALKARRIRSLMPPVIALIVATYTAFVVWRGAALIMEGVMTVGALTVFLAYLQRFFSPVKELAKMTNAIAQAGVGVERVRAILDTDMSVPERPNARAAIPRAGPIVFEHVGFEYDPTVPVLRNVSFTIEPGQRIGIVGPTGSGKSTVVSLLSRLYDPTAGRITMGGIDLRDYKLRSLRGQFGYVLQESIMLRGTVRENIAYGNLGATEEEINRAARLANADEFVAKMPQGYDTPVGERGLMLSGGQRQRIGIARAIVRDAPILILDEPTAALDAESEALVMDALGQAMKGRTVITIAHRLSTIRNSDKIVVLNEGIAAEQGSHEELLAFGGIYAELYRIQFGSPGKSSTAAGAAPASLAEATEVFKRRGRPPISEISSAC